MEIIKTNNYDNFELINTENGHTISNRPINWNRVSHLRDELKSKNVKIFRDIQERESGKNAIVLDPDDYMISLFEPNFSTEKHEQTSGYVGFTPQ